MVNLAANLSMMFTELPFLDRFAAAGDAGFTGVEFLFPYEAPAEIVAERARAAGVKIVLFNLPAGDWAGGERGLGALPHRIAEQREGAQRALDYAGVLGCGQLHLMAGKTTGHDRVRARETLVANVAYAADLVAGHDIEVLLEPINTRVDIPGYFYDTTAEVLQVIRDAGRPNVKLQYDIYHMQIMEGDLARAIERLLPLIAHIQLADNPGRGEPGTGEIAYPWLLRRIDALGYTGWIGCEYKPAGTTLGGLDWARPYIGK